MKIHNFLHSWC